jgi:hypothetical protein
LEIISMQRDLSCDFPCTGTWCNCLSFHLSVCQQAMDLLVVRCNWALKRWYV